MKKKAIIQFLSYFCVGGVSALVEWIVFFVFANIFNVFYLFSTIIAFVFSTTTNWMLGRKWTFANSTRYDDKKVKELLLVYGVSLIGLLYNLILMYLFVGVLHLDTPVLKVVCKICSTGIVFFWNFFVRKLWIYKE